MTADTEREGLDFDIAKSLRYHAYRRAFWGTVDNFSKVLTALSGTAVLVTFFAKLPACSEYFAFFVAVASALDLTLGFSSKARDHDGLYRRFSGLAQDVVERSSPDDDTIRVWRRRRLEIEMDEPGILDILERRCAKEEAIARGVEVNPAWKITRWEAFISQWAFWPSSLASGKPC